MPSDERSTDLIPRSIRFTAEDWQRIERAAEAFRIEPAVFLFRRVVLKKLTELSEEVKRRLSNTDALPF